MSDFPNGGSLPLDNTARAHAFARLAAHFAIHDFFQVREELMCVVDPDEVMTHDEALGHVNAYLDLEQAKREEQEAEDHAAHQARWHDPQDEHESLESFHMSSGYGEGERF